VPWLSFLCMLQVTRAEPPGTMPVNPGAQMRAPKLHGLQSVSRAVLQVPSGEAVPWDSGRCQSAANRGVTLDRKNSAARMLARQVRDV
jgi:hypothetical protein